MIDAARDDFDAGVTLSSSVLFVQVWYSWIDLASEILSELSFLLLRDVQV